MNRLYLYLVVFFISITSSSVYAADNKFITLCYHDIIEGLTDNLDEDQMAVGLGNLIAQFSWMKEQGYNVVSVQDILDGEQGKKPLPEKAVLITFDDGYSSIYKYLYPLLKMYDYTAVIAVVGKWLSAKPGEFVKYGDRDKKLRSEFLSWDQLREMKASGHIEIASHSFDLHHGELGNPQGNRQPSATTRIFNKKSQSYETDQQYYERIKTDLKLNSDLIEKNTGVRPRTMVWPYGASSKQTVSIAKALGMPVTMTLKAGNNTYLDLPGVRRKLVISNPSLSDFVNDMEQKEKQMDLVRGVRIDMDDIYDKDPKRFTLKFNQLLDRIKAMKVNTVYLSAFSDEDNDGYAESVYFSSKHFPTRADILNRVSWQIQTRAGGGDHIEVHTWMPIIAFENEHGNQLNEQAILGIYEDMAKYVYVEGLLFSDLKGAGSEGFPRKLINTVKNYRTRVKKAAILLSSQTVIDAAGNSNYWDNLNKYYNNFVINVNFKSKSQKTHIESLLQALPKNKDLSKFIFELQTVNGETNEKISATALSSEIDFLLENKAIQLSYYPDNVQGDHPPLDMIKSKISVREFPFSD
ncbi:MAG: poly-beta-1,6-N-acetyl-D-glucosamine N-deacetylase PgaB [Thiothrix sp.]|nr:MAG: poly-beta-1,6-N-acetyl-D-glucosamine N-deacetylase PgaB [Thiothrix sp.]